MRVAIITESYAPDVNGVANSVARVADHLMARGHEVMVIAPQPARKTRRLTEPSPYRVLRLPSMPLPGYSNVRLAFPSGRIKQALRDFKPDVVHLASPFVLGAWASGVASQMGLPMVAIYQTDVPAYARAYGFGPGERIGWSWISRIHRRAQMTLVPSSPTAAELEAHGITGVTRWARGVDTTLFHPQRRSTNLRKELAPEGEVIVGYVGRLAKEKCVDQLRDTAKLPGVKVVVVGDGPMRRKVEKAIPEANFLGGRSGRDLARVYASLDIFVHTGPHETFCQTIQEAMASGLPVVAPAAGGPLDLVQPGVTGYLVRPNDPAEFAKAVNELAGDPRKRTEFGVAARMAVANRTWSAIGDELISHYRTAIVRARAATSAPLELVA